ncbi:MAG TPA: type I restriction endonuclease subunit R [Rhodopirellula baltica]|uniref:Type I restriction enzyme endonuclease subunit n=1 Tax=Rhodopirellula baltica (strain DSM 10527 / NCIMB 13988 / SH1) TaxID=243090 RepID=Q7UEF4_RHOBA|nr:type I restriction endonuclease subunit R [Rhodopirellula baltica]CAD79082.1 HsdR [Rhodopirellula baltica SH 1]HBE62185.1 type I restriction endonuclease subunit R [Rhodopirellula baltica]
MAFTGINSEDRLVQATFADYMRDHLGWESVYAFNTETFGPGGSLGRANERDAVLAPDLKAAIARLNPGLPEVAHQQAFDKLTHVDFSRTMVQHNQTFYGYIRDGVPVSWRDVKDEEQHAHARVIDFADGEAGGAPNNRFVAVRELKVKGLGVPHYNRRADIVCYVNGLPLVVIELKAVYRNIRQGFDDNLTDYMSKTSINQLFHHNVFVVVSNGDRAKYGSITSKWEHFAEWKRNDEKHKGELDAKVLLDGMLERKRLLDIVENFILFDASRPDGIRKVVARNHQVLGVNNAVASVVKQEELKELFPIQQRLQYRMATVEMPERTTDPTDDKLEYSEAADATMHVSESSPRTMELPLVERAHPDLGRLGVFWHTQGSGKSYSMAFFAQKVRRCVPGNFTFVVMTDREDLDDQIFRTFVGCGVANDKTPRAGSGTELKTLLKQNHRFVFSLVHKFNQDVKPDEPYSDSADIIVMSDEAHRTQAGKLARNMRLALPNASFIGFTGTPLFKRDHITRRIFGTYISKYDFKRSQEDNSTVRLVYENRGEKLGLARLDLNDKIAEKVEEADLDQDQTRLLEKLLGQDYEVITADDRLDKLADDFVEHCSMRWQSGKAMFVCIDKITCGRMYAMIEPRWKRRTQELRDQIPIAEAQVAATSDTDLKQKREEDLADLRGRIAWMESTQIAINISEAQNEVRDFAKWGFDIVPHRDLIKRGFTDARGKNLTLEDAFKKPEHPFRVAIVCAMWLTGFDVECLSTLYIDKPMKAHTLMQAIARANRVYPGKDCGVIVDYNGMLKSLRKALAQYAVGDDDALPPDELAEPIENLVASLIDALEVIEQFLADLGFDVNRFAGAKGFVRIAVIRDGTDAVCVTDETRSRFEIMARELFSRFRALVTEPSIYAYAERHDNIEAIYKKLSEKRDTADVTELLKELHRIVNAAIRAAGPGDDHAEGLTIDLSQIDFEKLKEEFGKVPRKNVAIQDIRDVLEKKLAAMLRTNPLMMDYYRRYQEIIADYNREKDRTTVEQTFAALVALAGNLDEEQRRAVEEGLSPQEMAIFDLLKRDKLTKKDREKVKQASQSLLLSIRDLLAPMEHWTRNAQTQAEVETSILDWLFETLPRPPFSEDETNALAGRLYEHVWQQSEAGLLTVGADPS